MDDRDLVQLQLGRPPRAFRRVAARCPYGAPAVTEQDAYDVHGDPFPTTYYLTCPHLVAAVSRLEAQRRIRRGLAGTRRGADGGASLDWGIGGSRRPERLKCMHAHVGFALANPGYRIGERMLAEIPEPWPPGRCCTGARDT